MLLHRMRTSPNIPADVPFFHSSAPSSWTLMYESVEIKFPRYSWPHLSLTATRWPTSEARKGLGLIMFIDILCGLYSRISFNKTADTLLPCFLWCSFIGNFDIFFPFWMLPFCPMIENLVSKVFHPFPHQTKQACYQNYHKNYMRLSCYLCFFTVKS